MLLRNTEKHFQVPTITLEFGLTYLFLSSIKKKKNKPWDGIGIMAPTFTPAGQPPRRRQGASTAQKARQWECSNKLDLTIKFINS